jgi:methyl coenzyme M reductase subunit D
MYVDIGDIAHIVAILLHGSTTARTIILTPHKGATNNHQQMCCENLHSEQLVRL